MAHVSRVLWGPEAPTVKGRRAKRCRSKDRKLWQGGKLDFEDEALAMMVSLSVGKL
jgi:hypothetical protein